MERQTAAEHALVKRFMEEVRCEEEVKKNKGKCNK
jgi:hypothetical protein